VPCASLKRNALLTDVSASVPPDVDTKTEDVGDTTADPSARAKEAEVMIGPAMLYLLNRLCLFS
jgi:hypothetical protein